MYYTVQHTVLKNETSTDPELYYYLSCILNTNLKYNNIIKFF